MCPVKFSLVVDQGSDFSKKNRVCSIEPVRAATWQSIAEPTQARSHFNVHTVSRFIRSAFGFFLYPASDSSPRSCCSHSAHHRICLFTFDHILENAHIYAGSVSPGTAGAATTHQPLIVFLLQLSAIGPAKLSPSIPLVSMSNLLC